LQQFILERVRVSGLYGSASEYIRDLVRRDYEREDARKVAWVVDTCLLLDIGLDDRKFAADSEHLLWDKLAEGLLVCPVTFVELAPAFSGEVEALGEFLFQLGVDSQESWMPTDTRTACEAWARHVERRHSHQVAKRPIADVLIGAFAQRFQGLLTRNTSDFRRLFPQLRMIEP
jgi:Arc/MetJ-type ribon-helix-helix transcriptional regulator